MILYVKNMVCDRCISAVSQSITENNLSPKKVKLGMAVIDGEPDRLQLNQLQLSLEKLGFGIVGDKKQQVVEVIKSAVIRLIHQDFGQAIHHENPSEYLKKETGYDYNYISALFSSTEGITIEKYIILQKIERAKELISYNELNLSQIADQMGYSSIHALSNQFKKVTGMSPSEYRSFAIEDRKSLDKIL